MAGSRSTCRPSAAVPTSAVRSAAPMGSVSRVWALPAPACRFSRDPTASPAASTIQNGVLRITNSYALGSGAKTVTITQGGGATPRLELDGSGGDIVLVEFDELLHQRRPGHRRCEKHRGQQHDPGQYQPEFRQRKFHLCRRRGTLTLSGSIGSVTAAAANRLLVLSGSSTGANTVSGPSSTP